MKSKKRKNYTNSFKEEAVKQITNAECVNENETPIS